MSTLEEFEKLFQKYKVNIEDYIDVNEIGKGSSGIVLSALNVNTERKEAAKVFIDEECKSKYDKIFNREIRIMMELKNPTINQFLGFSVTDFNGEENLTVFMTFFEKGSLRKLLENVRSKKISEKVLNNTKKQIILIGIARGMWFLHQNNVIHRDLKPDNILIDDNYHPIISDFGLSKFYEIGHSKSQSQGESTYIYTAPEFDSLVYNYKVDIYSFAILMYEVVTNSFPYPILQKGKITIFNLMPLIIEKNVRPELKNKKLKEPIQNLIKQCWDKDPDKRPDFEYIFKKLAFDKENFYLDDVDFDAVQSYITEIYGENNLTINLKYIKSSEKMILKLQPNDDDFTSLEGQICDFYKIESSFDFFFESDMAKDDRKSINHIKFKELKDPIQNVIVVDRKIEKFIFYKFKDDVTEYKTNNVHTVGELKCKIYLNFHKIPLNQLQIDFDDESLDDEENIDRFYSTEDEKIILTIYQDTSVFDFSSKLTKIKF